MAGASSNVSARALCITRDSALRRTIRRALNAAGSEIEFCERLESPPAKAAIVIVDRESRKGCDELLLRAAGQDGKIIVVGDSLEDEEVLELLRLQPMDHVMSDVGDPDERELLITSAKLLSGDIFGLDKYLAWGITVHEHSIQSYDEKRAALAQVASHAATAGARRQLVTKIESVTDELLMNALYDAPAIHRGSSRHARVEKRADTVRPAEDAALLRYASDGRYFAVSVKDHYGELQKGAILEHLRRARAERGRPLQSQSETGGAGLGIYFILSAATQFIANIDPGTCTEVICLFDLRQDGRLARTCARSLHIFHT
ncbi:MAG TPA: hypothetical protein VNM90_22075 [Haliangium sp.]|nr:hypothetical protein [Haliangium sp.]